MRIPGRVPMTKKFGSNALGRGLKALIKDRKESGSGQDNKELEKERHARNMEFYGSLMKKYVASGADDELIEQMFEDIRKHMGISSKEHETLLSTLRKREVPKPQSPKEQEIAQFEIKEELSKIYLELQKGKKRRKNHFKQLEEDLRKGSKDAIPLSNGTHEEKPSVKKVIKRRLVARNLDERAGIITAPKGAKKAKLEWLDEEEQPIMMPAPKEGLEDEEEPIKMPPPKKGLEEESGPPLEMPPSVVPTGPPPGFEMRDVEERDHVKIPSTEAAAGKTEGIEYMAPTGKDEGAESISAMEEKGEPREVTEDMLTKGPEEEELEEMEELGEEEEEGRPGGVPETETGKGPVPDEEGETMERAPAKPEEPEKVKLDDSLLSLKMLIEEEQFDEALRMAERLLENEPDNVSVLNEKGVVLYHLGRTRDALEVYRSILDIEPDSVETLINYATILSLEGELDNSLEYLDKAVKKDPYSEDAWNNKAVVLTRAGRLREALECLDEALRINEKTPSTWMNAGIILEKMGEIGPAMECYRNLLELEPDNQVAIQGIEYCRSQLRE